ncbi:c-type cytochrome [Methylobacterium sp. 391_Methyba4]|uniref:c-type cytochrome n=1 Tax=Methylobacterium sp. 391_Methyba4 TaxID=3038924 RepID=UPI00242036FE|nr:c-type cytochrome [Methylobacterium sp. 391_Methyba4]WFS05364.1 c-type cytochrome [Methylobacterium sp. 391_Methyba4]
MYAPPFKISHIAFSTLVAVLPMSRRLPLTASRSVRIAFGGLLMCVAVCPAHAMNGGEIARNGTQAGVPACASCHGDAGGGSAEGGFPRLSGLAEGYLAHELHSFADGSRDNEIMGPIAQGLTPEERRALAVFYAGLRALPPDGTAQPDDTASDRGRILAQIGEWTKALPACAQCHGPAGQGVGEAFPALNGQPAAYLVAQLSAWKAGTRRNDPLGLMKGIADRLSDDDATAVAAYYAALPATAIGGGR